MGILDEDVAEVRAASDIVGVITQYVQLRKVGRRWTGLCPFHPENTPSFSVNAEEGLYYCLAGETRVLTWGGVRPIRELAGSTTRVLTERGKWVDAPFLSFGVQPLMRVILTRNRQRKEIYATPEHRWLVRGKGTHRYELTTETLRPGQPLDWSFPSNRTRLLGDLSPFGIAHGIAFGDGDNDAELPPSLDESPSYLAGWLAGYIAAGGDVDDEGNCLVISPKRPGLEFVRDVCTRLGIGTFGITTESEMHSVELITEDLDERFFLVEEHRRRFAGSTTAWARRGWVVQSVEETDRVEEVFCAVVDGTHNFVLEDNILTGNCFGCQVKGDVITFVREMEHLDFVGALEWLAAKLGRTLRYSDQAQGEGRKRRARLVELMTSAVDWYHERLLSSPDAGAARSYLRQRGLDGEVVRDYRIGWAPDDWDAVCRALRLSEDDARDTGLGFRNSRNRLQDSFRARVLFPIFDDQGAPVSFGGRILPGGEGKGNHGKYKNTPETPLYHKSKVLYGLDRSKSAIVSSDTAVVCEGYTDVIGFHRSGVPVAVATCGTALTDEHVKLLRRFARHLVLAFDADGAGQAAAERFYQWERDHDLEVKVADLPVGKDPGDLAQTDPERLAAAVEGARPFLRFRLDRAFAAADLSSPEGRARAAEQALGIVAEHPSPMMRDQYLMDVAGRVRVDLERLRPMLDEIQRGVRSGGGPARSSQGSGPGGPGPAPRRRTAGRDRRHAEGPALEVLRHAVHNRDEVAPWLRVELFADPLHGELFETLVRADSTGVPVTQAISDASPDVADLLAQLVVGEPTSEPFDAVRRLLTESARAELAELRLQAGSDVESSDLLADSAFLSRCMLDLRDAEASVAAADRLLAFLGKRVGDGG
ncbi:MAG TPA: DNA primase [Acidimicrobiales bacterium]|jgi:DNA primase